MVGDRPEQRSTEAAPPVSGDHDELTSEPFRCLHESVSGGTADNMLFDCLDPRLGQLRPHRLQVLRRESSLVLDRIRGTVKAREHASALLYLSGGVIPDRGNYALRLAGSKARIGELDEEFVWERSLGDTFPFGNQAWQIVRVTHNDVEVAPASSRQGIIPFWRADALNRPFRISEKIGAFLEVLRGLIRAAAPHQVNKDGSRDPEKQRNMGLASHVHGLQAPNQSRRPRFDNLTPGWRPSNRLGVPLCLPPRLGRVPCDSQRCNPRSSLSLLPPAQLDALAPAGRDDGLKTHEMFVTTEAVAPRPSPAGPLTACRWSPNTGQSLRPPTGRPRSA